MKIIAPILLSILFCWTSLAQEDFAQTLDYEEYSISDAPDLTEAASAGPSISAEQRDQCDVSLSGRKWGDWCYSDKVVDQSQVDCATRLKALGGLNDKRIRNLCGKYSADLLKQVSCTENYKKAEFGVNSSLDACVLDSSPSINEQRLQISSCTLKMKSEASHDKDKSKDFCEEVSDSYRTQAAQCAVDMVLKGSFGHSDSRTFCSDFSSERQSCAMRMTGKTEENEFGRTDDGDEDQDDEYPIGPFSQGQAIGGDGDGGFCSVENDIDLSQKVTCAIRILNLNTFKNPVSQLSDFEFDAHIKGFCSSTYSEANISCVEKKRNRRDGTRIANILSRCAKL